MRPMTRFERETLARVASRPRCSSVVERGPLPGADCSPSPAFSHSATGGGGQPLANGAGRATTDGDSTF